MWMKPDTPAKHALLVIGLAALYRALWIGWFDAGPDEAYYWAWSTRLDWGYVDHPPLVAYVLWLVRWVSGEAPWGWRATAILLSATGTWLVFCAGRTLFSERVGYWAAVGLSVSPLYSMGLGVMLLPESLLVFWTAVALYLAAKLLTTNRLALFYPLGAAFGLGMLSNPPALLIPAGLVLFGLISKQHRRWFGHKEPYLGVLLGLAIFSPAVFWNWQHDWAGVGFLSERTAISTDTGEPGLQLAWQSVFSQALCHTPLVFVMLWAGTVGAIRRVLRGRGDPLLLLLCFSLPVVIVFHIMATFRATLAHWPSSAYLAAYVAASAVLFHDRFVWSRSKKALAGLTLGIAIAISASMPLLLVYPVASKVLEHLRVYVSVPPEAIEPMAQSAGWGEEIRDGLLQQRQRLADEAGQPPVILTHFNVLAGLLSYHLRDDCEVVAVHAQARQYNIWFDDNDLRDKPILFVSAELFDRAAAGGGRPQDYYDFEECTEQPPIEVVRRGITINRVHLWRCAGYQGPIESTSAVD